MSRAELFQPLPADVESRPNGAETDVLREWREQKTFESVQRAREKAPAFVFWEGPPTANGRPGIHHVLARTVKDSVCRYQTMRGKRVDRKAGWDTHGLPVELEVEKKLGISGKPQIEEYGVARFNAQCRESVWTYKKEWEELSERTGYWLDYSHPYVTYENEYIESVWNLLGLFHGKGLVYRGKRVLPFCGRCGTGLSSGRLSGRDGSERHGSLPSAGARRHRARELPRVDDDSLDPAEQFRSGRAPRSRVCARPRSDRRTCGRAARDRLGCRRARTGRPAEGSSDPRSTPRKRARREGLRAPVLGGPSRRPDRLGVARGRRGSPRLCGRLRHRRGRNRDRAPGALRRRRLGPRARKPSPRARRRRFGRTLREGRRTGTRLDVLQGGRRRVDGGPEGARSSLPQGARVPQLPALLALLDTAVLFSRARLVHPHDSAEGADGRAQSEDPLGAAGSRGEALRRVAGEQRRLEHLSRPVLGHAAAFLGVRRLRRRGGYRKPRESRRACGETSRRPRSISTGPPSTRSLFPVQRVEKRCVARRRCSIAGSIPARCPTRSTAGRSARGARRIGALISRPTSSPRGSTRRGAGSTPCTPSARSSRRSPSSGSPTAPPTRPAS